MTEQTDRIIENLIANREHYIELVSAYVKQREQCLTEVSSLFHEDIDKDFIDIVSYTIANEITKVTCYPLDSVLEILEDFDLKRYIYD